MISSSSNPLIKKIKLLRVNQKRKKLKQFLVEGLTEMQFALEEGFTPVEFVFCSKLLSDKSKILRDQLQLKKIKCLEIHENCYDAIAIQDQKIGLIGVFEDKKKSLQELVSQKKPYHIVVLESVEKPGNLGAIARTCVASNTSAIVVLDSKVDPYNPNAIRSSVGAVFKIPIVQATQEDFVDFCKVHQVQIYFTSLSHGSTVYSENQFQENCAVVFGVEHYGIQKKWEGKNINIPMLTIDSLNLSNSVAIINYEIFRQRNFKL